MSGQADDLRLQYEAYPYPARDPADEKKRLIAGSPSHLLEVNHFVFGGRRDFSRPFRALVAGGGTGDGAVMLAQQLRDRRCPGEVVYVDVSRAAMGIAEARARARGLANVRFHRLSIGELPASDLARAEPFDYIDCCGVLHHLDDPAAGLATLASLLADDGGLGVMVYGALGRTGVYPAQEMLRALAADAPLADRIALARRLLEQLPPTNWLKRNPFVADHLAGGDAGLVDLLLHVRDRAFSVPEIAALADAAGLRVTAFVEPARYEPASYLSDPRLIERLGGLSWLERAAFAERLAGNMKKHVFYAVKTGNRGPAVASPDDGAAIPVLRDDDGAALAAEMKPGGVLKATLDMHPFRFPLPKLAGAIAARIDGRRTIDDIDRDLAGVNERLDRETFGREFAALFRALNGLGKLFLSSRPW